MTTTEFTTLYDQDYYTWSMRNAQLIRQGRFDEIDVDHLAEEVEDMGKSTQRELVSSLIVLLAHLLKWQYEPDQRARHGRSWRLTIQEQRRRLAILLHKNPGLKPLMNESVEEAYSTAQLIAARETDRDETAFPEVCPFAFEDALDNDFWPD